MCFHPAHVQPLKQPSQLPLINLHNLLYTLRPGKFVLLKPFLPQAKTIPVPIQNLDPVTCTIAENEHVPGKRVHLQALLYQDAQSIDGFSHIRAPQGQVHLGTR